MDTISYYFITYTGYRPSRGEYMHMSRLQLFKDTFILGEKSWENVCSMCVALILFEAILGLIVNFN